MIDLPTIRRRIAATSCCATRRPRGSWPSCTIFRFATAFVTCARPCKCAKVRADGPVGTTPPVPSAERGRGGHRVVARGL